MNPLHRLADWLDVRPGERRTVALTTLGAFLVVAFHITARSLREAFFIDEFSVAAFPYVTMATAVVNIPSVLLFTRALGRRSPFRIYRSTLVVVGVGLVLLYAVTTWPVSRDLLTPVATVAFFIWTAVGSLLIASGFWVLTAERFGLRDAKRLFGLITAGGTLGGLAGLGIGPLADIIGNGGLVLGLIGMVALSWLLQRSLPGETESSISEREALPVAVGSNLRRLAGHPYLRAIAAIVTVATMASYLLDYQFKEFVEARFQLDEDMAGFFGVFYGLTGVIALLLQTLVASRLLAGAGVSLSLSVLPIALIGGGAALLLAPGLVVATLVRGADNSLRRSLHRSVIEYLFVPIPPTLRRRTKSLIDSLVDNGAEGLAALFVSIWLAAGLSSRLLAFPLILLALLFLVLAWDLGRRYMATLLERLKEGRAALDEDSGDLPADFASADLTMTVSNLDLSTLLDQSGIRAPSDSRFDKGTPDGAERGSRLERLQSPDAQAVARELDSMDTIEDEEVPFLVRLLARDPLSARAGELLAACGESSLEPLIEVLLDEDEDFVIRRRVPRILAKIDSEKAGEALLEALHSRRFEVRYRSTVALARRRRDGLSVGRDAEKRIWEAIEQELSRERPIWELQRLLDDQPARDDFVADRVYGRGELSLEHTFRLLSLVLDTQPIRTAFFGIVMDDDRLRGISLEYLEQVLPTHIRNRLWPFIGDISEHQRRREIRDMNQVVDDLLKTGATLFAGDDERARLREALRTDPDPEEEP